jgi:sugar (pentulose or hexulose) kinase
MTANPLWMGLDLGTQSVRALVADEHGELHAAASRPLRSHRRDDRHEQDPEEWWQATTDACREALGELDASQIRGVACDSTSGTVVLLDRDQRPITPALMYDDARAADETELVNDCGGDLWSSLGYAMGPSWGLPKLVWLWRHCDGLSGVATLAHQADLVNRRLVGEAVATDSSHALKTGYDLLHERWPAEIIDLLELPEDIFPEVVRSGGQLGIVGARASEATGLDEGTPVFAGMTDGCAAQIGAGALEPGTWNSALGTTLVLKGVTRELIRDPAGVMYSHLSPDGDWLPGGASSVGAGVLSDRFDRRDLDELDRAAKEREPSRVIAYPLVSRGERFPFRASEAEGFELGTPRDEADAYAALLQGVAFVERLCFEYVDLLGAPVQGPVRLTGGAARSRYWCQLRADVLERPVVVPRHSEPALGMAILAGAGDRSLSHAARRMVALGETIEPRADHADRLREPYLRLIDELERRGWLDQELASHGRDRRRQ